MASDKAGTRIMAIILATLVQVEGWPVDHKLEARDFANVGEIGLRVLGEYRHRVAAEVEFTI